MVKSTFWLPVLLAGIVLGSLACRGKSGEREGEEGYDGPAERAALETRKTMDPALGYVPKERLYTAMRYTDNLRSIFNRIDAAGVWTERGPNSDTVGASNGNTRANSGIAAGRIRAVMIDANDASGNTIWIGGVNGGLWKTTDITASPATWVPQSDFFSNMAIAGICQNPAAPQTMYFATGESYGNADAVAGDGVWKSTNGGISWAQLPSTTGSSFDLCTRILCDNTGNVYVTSRSGVFRSINGGTSWTTITPSGLTTSRFSDMELSSTGRLHVSAGVFSTCTYHYTDNPATVASAGWTAPTSGYPTSGVRIELGCQGNTLYALPSDGSYEVPTIYKSIDGGANWIATVGQPTVGWGSGQAWYNLSIGIESNPNNVIVGALEPYRSTDGGATWTRIGRWVGPTGQYVHADIHYISWEASNRVLIGCDGGLHYSTDGGTTIRDRNVGLRIKQFYACDYHPTDLNYFLAGAQDNGSHRFRAPGLAGSTEVTGGDGAWVHIDQDEPQYQFTSYVYNQYRRSTNGGTSWSNVNLSTSIGQFINPTEYDDVANIMYCSNSNGTYRRWTNPQTGSTNASITIPELNSSAVFALTVSPYTANRLYMGTAGGRVVYVDNANTIATGSNGTNISTGLPGAAVSCVAIGTTDNNLMAVYSSYGVNQVNVSTDGGTSWTTIDGNLPDMPVRWALFYPNDNTKAIIATEAGVYITELINGASTSWYPSPTFPLVRVDMIKYRPSDGMLVAATHGRGLWTQTAATILPLEKFMLSGNWQGENTARVNWNYDLASAQTKFEVYASYDGSNFEKVGNANYNGSTQYSFSHNPAQGRVFYRIRAIEQGIISKYSNVIKMDKSRVFSGIELQTPSPNPVIGIMTVQFDTESKGNLTLEIIGQNGQRMMNRAETITARGTYTRQWDVSKLAAGTYTLLLRKDGVQVSKKFVKL